MLTCFALSRLPGALVHQLRVRLGESLLSFLHLWGL